MANASPEQVAAARLVLDSRDARAGTKLGYEIANIGKVPLMFGSRYALERKSPSGWAPANADMYFRLWGRTLRPGDRYSLEAKIPADADVGDYRLRKQLRPEWERVTDSAVHDDVGAQTRDQLELIAGFRVVA